MPYTRVHRLLRIITLIQGAARSWTAAALAEACGVEERTIYRDLTELEGVGIPVRFDRSSGGYRLPPEFFLPPIQLSIDESLALAALCEQVAGAGQIAGLEPAWRALTKLTAALPAAVRDELSERRGDLRLQLAASEDPLSSADVFERVRAAIADRTVLDCLYEAADAEGQPERFDFHPYTLLFSVRAWYAVGHHAARGSLRTLKLSRFAALRPTDRTFSIPDNFSLESYLGNAWRMIRGETTYAVELEFDADVAAGIGETRWHATQEIEPRPDGSILMRCTVDGLDEIVWWVLSMGPSCRVLRPAALAERVAELAARTAALYTRPPDPPAPPPPAP